MSESHRRYKHYISPDLLIEVITASQEKFKQKEEQYEEIGVQRKKSDLFPLYLYPNNPICTFISDAIIENKDAGTIVNITNTKEMLSVIDATNNEDMPSVIFKNCKLVLDLEVKNILSQQDEPDTFFYFSSCFVKSICFDNCKMGFIGATEGSRPLVIDLTGKTVAENIQLEGSDAFSIELSGGAVAEGIKLSKESEVTLISVGEGSEAGDIRIEERSRAQEIKLYEESKVEKFWLSGESVANNIIFTGASITLFRAAFSMLSITATNSSISEMLIQDSYVTEFRFGSQRTTEAFIKNSLIDILNLQQTVLYEEASITFSSVKIHACLLEQLTVLGHLFFRGMSALHAPFELPIYASEMTKMSYKKFKKELPARIGTEKSVFRLTHSSLGQTEFIDSDLESFNRFEFSHSRITGIFISGLKPPDNIFIRGLEESEPLIDDWEKEEQKVSLYNQFARIFEVQGFIYNAVKFRSRSALHQQNILRKKLLDKKITKGSNSNSTWSVFLEYLPFFLNRWSNNHGESWGRALLFILSTSAFLYIGYICSMGTPTAPSQNSLWAQVGYYFEFINPFRPFDFMSDAGYKMNTLTRFIDLLSRLIIGYGVYHFLTAFRKYRKK